MRLKTPCITQLSGAVTVSQRATPTFYQTGSFRIVRNMVKISAFHRQGTTVTILWLWSGFLSRNNAVWNNMVVTEVFYNPYIAVLAPESSAICETLCWSLLLVHVAGTQQQL